MPRTLPSLMACALTCAGCASSPKPPDVGAVVVAPQVVQPPVPALVLEMEPLAPGYFQRRLMERRTKKTTPTGPTF